MTKKYWGAKGKQRGNPDGFVHTQINFYNRKELRFYSLLSLCTVLSVN